MKSTPPRITFLIGHKGVGRTTLLRRLAESDIPLWGRRTRFVDLDDDIQKRALMPLEMILQNEGEAGLAERERQALDGWSASGEPLCIALGSGFTQWSHPALDRESALFVWVRRRSDEAGRIFLDRPRMNTGVPPLQEFEERVRFRASRFSRIAHLEFWLREGATTFSEDERNFFTRRPLLSLESLALGRACASSHPLPGTPLGVLFGNRTGAPVRAAVLATSGLEAERLATPLSNFCVRRRERLLELPIEAVDGAAALAALPKMGIRWAVLGSGLRAAGTELARAHREGAAISQRARRVGVVDLLLWDAGGELRLADCCSVPGVRVLFREWARRAGFAQPRQAGDMALWGEGALLPVVRDEVPQALPPGAQLVVEEDEDAEGPPPYPRVLVSICSRDAFRLEGSPMPPDEWNLDWLIDTEAGFESPGREIAQARGARYLGGDLLQREFGLEIQRVISGFDHF